MEREWPVRSRANRNRTGANKIHQLLSIGDVCTLRRIGEIGCSLVDRTTVLTGSSNGHSPVLNLSKTAGSGSVGEHSGSEAEASHRSQDDEEDDDNLSEDLDDDNEKDEGEKAWSRLVEIYRDRARRRSIRPLRRSVDQLGAGRA